VEAGLVAEEVAVASPGAAGMVAVSPAAEAIAGAVARAADGEEWK
jgi:hypothetical protein